MDFIQGKGKPVITPVIITNTFDYAEVVPEAAGTVDINTKILTLKSKK